jgi:predicted TIM-barrel fold metal-dependent hydrolase
MTTTATMERTASERTVATGMVDCDAHVTEPPDLWSSRAPAAFRDRMPQMRTIDGVTNWYLDDEYWCTIGGNVIEQGPEGARKVVGSHILQPFARVAEAAWQVQPRLDVMDHHGIAAQVLYPNAIGFSSNHMLEVADAGLRTAILQTYNDYLADTQRESGGRLYPQGLLPIWDMDLVVREMRRGKELGLTGFVLTDRPDLVDLPQLDEPYWEPMWELASDLSLPLNFHIGSGRQNAKKRGGQGGDAAWGGYGPQKSLAISATQLYMSNVRIIANLLMSTLFDRYPGLKIISPESGIGWIPFALEALEYQRNEMITTERDQLKTPTEYFREHIYPVFWFESHAPRTSIEAVGVNNVLVETDFPHPTCLFPSVQEHFGSVLGDLDPAIRNRVLRDNAIDVWGLPLTYSPA